MDQLAFFLNQPVMQERDAREFLLMQAADFYLPGGDADALALVGKIRALLTSARFAWPESWRINRMLRSRYRDIFERVDALGRIGGSCMMPEDEAWARRGFAFKGLCLLAKGGVDVEREAQRAQSA